LQKQQVQHWAIAIVLGLLGTIQYHSAQFTSRFDIMFGDRGDVRGVLYFCEHWYQWLMGKADLMSPGIFYPIKNTLAYSDLLLGYAIPYSIARLFGFGMFSSIEIVVIVFTFLGFISCYVLLKQVLNFKMFPACAAAMFFAFNSPKFHQLPHLQLQYVFLLPLIFACVIKFVRKSQQITQREATGWLAAAGLLWLLQATTAFYFAWFLVLWTIPFVFFAALLPASRRLIIGLIQKFWRAGVTAGAILLVGFGFFLLIHLPGVRAGEWYRYDFVTQIIPSWWSLMWMGDGNYLWRWLTRVVVPNPRPPTWNELMIGFGLIPTVAWLVIVLWVIWRLLFRKGSNNTTAPSSSTAFLAAAVLATTLLFLVGMKYGGHSPWYFVYEYFPGGKAVRAVSRYVIFLSLPMAIGFAFMLDRACDWVAQQKSRQTRLALMAALGLIATFAVFEQFGIVRVRGLAFSKKAEEAYLNAMAAKLPRDCGAFYIAPGKGLLTTAEYQYDAMLISIITGIPTLNASSSQFPRDWGLYFVHAPEYEASVKKWIELQHLQGKVCRLEIGPQYESFDIRAGVPLEDSEFIIRQYYRDLAGSEPSPEEIKPYVERFERCKQSDTCDRFMIASELFRTTGFAEDGSFILRTYEIGLGRLPTFEEFSIDLARLRAAGEPDKKSEFVRHFVQREDFLHRYAALSDESFTEKLAENFESRLAKGMRPKISPAGRPRWQILLDVVDDPEHAGLFWNRSVVALHYYGYLAREPDVDGISSWVQVLEQTGDLQKITSGFLTSSEYRNRFSR
jgi:hypothetical protein